VTRERLNEGDLFVAPSNSTQRPSIYFELIFLYGMRFGDSKTQKNGSKELWGPLQICEQITELTGRKLPIQILRHQRYGGIAEFGDFRQRQFQPFSFCVDQR
jgi:hypothetical protein